MSLPPIYRSLTCGVEFVVIEGVLFERKYGTKKWAHLGKARQLGIADHVEKWAGAKKHRARYHSLLIAAVDQSERTFFRDDGLELAQEEYLRAKAKLLKERDDLPCAVEVEL